jgi:acyl carrier protein
MIKNKKLLKIFEINLKLSLIEIENLKKGKIDIKFNDHPRWDSLNHVKILSELEKKFKIEINEKNYQKFTSIKKIDKLI